jgi:hypothetical protein
MSIGKEPERVDSARNGIDFDPKRRQSKRVNDIDRTNQEAEQRMNRENESRVRVQEQDVANLEI